MDLTALVNVYNLLNIQRPISIDERWTHSDVLPIAGGRTEMDLQRVQTPTGATFDPNRQRNPNFGRVTAYQPAAADHLRPAMGF